MKYVWEKYYKKSKSDTTGNLTLTVMCKPDLSGIKRGVENPCLWKCSSVTCEIFMDMIILDKKLLDLFASHLFDEELWKALWLELLLHVERVNKRLIFVVADVHFGFTLCTSARCGFLLWRHVVFWKMHHSYKVLQAPVWWLYELGYSPCQLWKMQFHWCYQHNNQIMRLKTKCIFWPLSCRSCV